MKYLLSALLLLSFCCSCGSQMEDKPFIECNTHFLIEYPQSTCKYANNINSWIANVVLDHFYDKESTLTGDSSSISSYYECKIRQAVEEYRRELRDVPEDSASYTDSLIVECVFESDSVITYRVHHYSCYGVTHPWNVRSYVSFRKADGLILRFADIVKEREREELIAYVLNKVNLMKEDNTPESFSVDGYLSWSSLDFHKPDENGFPGVAGCKFEFHNPAIVNGGLMFYFYPCELGSEAEGEYEVLVPETELTEHRNY